MTIGVDTSVAIPLLVRPHRSHQTVADWWRGRGVALCGHAAAETYSVLTRLPGDLRTLPEDAARLIAERFEAPVVLSIARQRRLHQILADHGIAGGAVYDALAAIAARDAGITLATRDARARATYARIGATVEVVA
jgi:predicted nucleic acid-binding protein